MCMVNSAQFDPCFGAFIRGVSYTIAARKMEDGVYRVTRVNTVDPKFVSPEGLRVGDSLRINSTEELFEAPYFEVYAGRGKRWVPIVGFLGQVNIVGEKGSVMKNLQSLELSGGASVKVSIGGFIEQEPAR